MRFVLIPIRTNKQGVQINVGKDGDEYNAIVNTMTMHPEDMKELGVAAGATIRVRTEIGDATFQCKEGERAARAAVRPVRPADVPAHGRRDRRNRNAHLEGLGRGSGSGLSTLRTKASRRRSTARQVMTTTNATTPRNRPRINPPRRAWEEIETGRFMPRRIRGSCRGLALG